MNSSGGERNLANIAPILIAVIAVLIRLAPLLHTDLSFAYRADDSFEYLQLAQGMRHRCGFARIIGDSCQAAEILRTPGYPLYLSVMPSVRWALAIQAILMGIVSLIVAIWIKQYWNLGAAILAELLIAFDFPSIVLTNEIMSETLFQFAIVSALIPPLLVVSRLRRIIFTAIFTGILAGCAILIRPIGILLPVLLPIPFLIGTRDRREGLIGGALAFAIPTVIVGAWSLRNYVLAGYLGLSTVGAINMYYYRAANLAARQEGVLLATARDSFGPRLGVPYQMIYEADVQSPELTRRMNQLGFQVLAAHPLETVVMTLQSSIYLALSPIRTPLAEMLGTAGASAGDGLNAGVFSLSRIRTTLMTILTSPVLISLVLLQVFLTIVVWIGIGLALIRCAHATAEYRLWVLYLSGAGVILLTLAAGGEADARFRAPVIPLLAIVAAIGYFPDFRFNRVEFPTRMMI
jgi:hypothetical protein